MKVLKFLFTITLFANIVACNDDIETTTSHEENVLNETNTPEMIVLGNIEPNPYTSENLTNALEIVKEKYPEYTKNLSINFLPNSNYVRFLPKNNSELEFLHKTFDFLSDFPLNYEILKAGDYYHDPEIPANKPTYQYTVVSIDEELPSTIDYEILDESVSFTFSDDDPYIQNYGETVMAAIQDEAHRLVGMENLIIDDKITKDDFEEIQNYSSRGIRKRKGVHPHGELWRRTTGNNVKHKIDSDVAAVDVTVVAFRSRGSSRRWHTTVKSDGTFKITDVKYRTRFRYKINLYQWQDYVSSPRKGGFYAYVRLHTVDGIRSVHEFE